MQMSQSLVSIAPALAKAQALMGAATKGAKNPFFKSSYATLGDVMEVVKEPLNANGIAILQPTGSDEKGHYVETILLHSSGEYYGTDRLYLELGKKDMQSLGSAISYARRYQLQSLTSTPSEDDDGEKAVGRGTAKAAEPATETLSNVSSIKTDAPKKTSGFRRPGQAAPTGNTAPAANGDLDI